MIRSQENSPILRWRKRENLVYGHPRRGTVAYKHKAVGTYFEPYLDIKKIQKLNLKSSNIGGGWGFYLITR
jgi:hypothetical protein